MKTIVVYYSLEGNTAYAAEKIAEKTGADLLRISPQKAYPTGNVKKFLWGGKSAVMAETPALEAYSFDADAYDRVILGFPIWASNIAPPIRTFVKENDLKDKRVCAVACQSGNGAEKAFRKLCECIGIEALEATLILIDPKARPKKENDEKIDAFCKALQKGGED